MNDDQPGDGMRFSACVAACAGIGIVLVLLIRFGIDVVRCSL